MVSLIIPGQVSSPVPSWIFPHLVLTIMKPGWVHFWPARKTRLLMPLKSTLLSQTEFADSRTTGISGFAMSSMKSSTAFMVPDQGGRVSRGYTRLKTLMASVLQSVLICLLPGWWRFDVAAATSRGATTRETACSGRRSEVVCFPVRPHTQGYQQ
ncbi:Uncharacterised protein [Klebsiella oxytoca]|nr:Uncharacterised protein [Klebsiella oxytoca]